ncbi:MAG: hypothetical protein R3Y32_00745 [Bacillota bacterium]
MEILSIKSLKNPIKKHENKLCGLMLLRDKKISFYRDGKFVEKYHFVWYYYKKGVGGFI